MAVVTTFGVFWLQKVKANEVRLHAVPAKPVLEGWPVEFQLRVEAALRAVPSATDTAAALRELAALLHANGFLAEASRCYSGLEQSGAADPKSLYRHAMILADYGEAAPALERLASVVRESPEYTPAPLRKGDLLLKQDRVEEASAAFSSVHQREPENPYATLGLARCEMDQGNWTRAREWLEATQSSSQQRLGYDLIVTVYERLGLQEEARQARARTKAQGTYRDMVDPWMDELRDLSYEPSQLALAATSHKENGNLERARALLNRALRFSPDDAKLHFQLGMMLKEQQAYKDALPHFERCTQLDPTFADGWVHLWDVLSALGLKEQARIAFATGLRHCPDSYGMNLMVARELRGSGRLREAVPYFEKVIRIRPTEPDAYIDLGLTHFALNDAARGIDAFERALVAEPDHPVVLTALTFHAIQAGDAAQALRWLERCRAQPRVSKEDLQQLTALFRSTFPGR